MKWSQKKLEEIYRKAMKRSMTDEAFRKKLQADSASALAEIAGEDLPGEVWLKFIERDPNYVGTFVLPDYISDELDIRALEKVTGGAGEDPGQSDGGSDEVDSNDLGLSFVLIISACAVAVSVAACGADACGAAAGCAAQACGAAACGAIYLLGTSHLCPSLYRARRLASFCVTTARALSASYIEYAYKPSTQGDCVNCAARPRVRNVRRCNGRRTGDGSRAGTS